MTIHEFKDVTLLITNYNRCKSLERLLKSFRELNCSFEDIVISDDASQKQQIDYILTLQSEYNFRLITTPENKGLGNNINKGQDSVKTKYTLYIQEDFVPQEDFVNHFSDALKIMKEDKHWDIISLYAYERYPYIKPYKLGYSERIFKSAPWYTNNIKFFLYSDHPHLRKSDFLQKFGRYPENVNVDQSEMQMSLSFIKNNGRALVYDDHYGLLTQDNPVNEPSTASFRNSWRTKTTVPILIVKWLYAKYKFIKLNVQLLATKAK